MAAGRPLRIVSGGQTGVDRAALDVALLLGFEIGGWCPRGRRAEDGPISENYPLTETAGADYSRRTVANVRDSDATLVLSRGQLSGGTALTRDTARTRRKPFLVLDLRTATPDDAAAWIKGQAISVLNVAGPRESAAPGIYEEASSYLRRVLGSVAAR